MTRLYKLDNGSYMIHLIDADCRYLEFSELAMMSELEKIGIPRSEILIALEELNKDGRDFAEFGVLKSFVRTANQSYPKRA